MRLKRRVEFEEQFATIDVSHQSLQISLELSTEQACQPRQIGGIDLFECTVDRVTELIELIATQRHVQRFVLFRQLQEPDKHQIAVERSMIRVARRQAMPRIVDPFLESLVMIDSLIHSQRLPEAGFEVNPQVQFCKVFQNSFCCRVGDVGSERDFVAASFDRLVSSGSGPVGGPVPSSGSSRC